MLCSLACRCAKKSQEKSFKYFGLQDYGRCFSGQHVASTYNTHGSSNNCYNQHYKKCDDNAWGECVGKNNNVNYVYEIQEGTYTILDSTFHRMVDLPIHTYFFRLENTAWYI